MNLQIPQLLILVLDYDDVIGYQEKAFETAAINLLLKALPKQLASGRFKGIFN